jgi:acyl-coenzyme A thioesterase PaaI-like protein
MYPRRNVGRARTRGGARDGGSRGSKGAMNGPSLQELYAPASRCFGCGPANERGLRVRSFPASDALDAHVVASFTPEPHHAAFEGVLNGGVIGALLDCHMNWTSVLHLLRSQGLDRAPCCVTAEFKVVLKRPTPLVPGQLDAWVVSSADDRATIEATLSAGDKVCALGSGTFVAVKPGHPAYHRW